MPAAAPQENSSIRTGQHPQIAVDAEYADIFNSEVSAAQQSAISPSIPPPMLDTQRVKSLLLSSLDMPTESVTPELADTLTQILRESIQGLLELQQQREAMKESFRLSVTKFKSAENNPLRFSANVEDALYNLLVKRNPAYLAPAAAVTSSFKDAQWHQTAMQHAINTAFFNMMQQFDPQRFGTATSKRWSLFGNQENAAWQQYNKQYAELRKQSDGGFTALFGSAFAHAYQEELDRLRQQS
jgi:type VI secretion system FHA domain protein